jgi:hypothetical protein
MRRMLIVCMLVCVGLCYVLGFLNPVLSAPAQKTTECAPIAALTQAAKGAEPVVPAWTLLSLEKGRVVRLSVSPDRSRLCYSVRRDNGMWEWAIMDPSVPDLKIRYSGQSSNEFGVIGTVWSPQSGEVSVGLGYASVVERWVRVSATAHDPKMASMCSEMVSADSEKTDNIVMKGGHSPWPAWGCNGRYYEKSHLAAKDNVTAFQRGESRAATGGATKRTLYCGDKAYTVLIDNGSGAAHAFKGYKYLGSCRVAGQSVGGWYLLSRPDGHVVAVKQLLVVDTSVVDPGRRGTWEWVAADLGPGRVQCVFDMKRGALVYIAGKQSTRVILLPKQLP